MDKYEISLWEDFLDVTSAGVEFLNERKLCTIGSDDMETQTRALEPKMVSNVNGTNTFTFKMYNNYIDDFTGEKFKNPFLSLLINERKVKVLWKNKWYDLVIKNIDEDSTGKGTTYTCEDLAITELSKNGYNLEFSSDLQNNIGTANELVKQVLDGSGWSFDEENSAHIIQKTEEPVYESITNNIVNVTLQSQTGDTNKNIPSSKQILVFYSSIIDIVDIDFIDKEIQFLYSENGYSTDENEMLVNNGDCYIGSFQVKKNGDYVECYQNNSLKFRVNTADGVSLRYRANRLVKTQITEYDSLLERHVNLYTDTQTGNQVYGYQTSYFTDPLAIVNFVVNSSNFKNTEGWIGDNITFGVYPKITQDTNISTYSGTSYLKVSPGYVYNYAFSSNKQYLTPSQGDIKNGDIGGIQVGEKYVFRLKFKADSEDPSASPYLYTDSILPYVATFDSNYAPSSESYFSISGRAANESWYEYYLTCVTPCSAENISNLGLFLKVNDTSWIEDIQFFKYAVGVKSYDEAAAEERINPGEISLQGIQKISYKYYNIDHNGVTSPEELEFLYEGDVDSDRFTPIYNNYEKMTSIEASKSNRFNILQSIAETFECWIRFVINHDQRGKTIFNDDGAPQKYVVLVESIGKDLGWSFEYGIDLKSIKRKIISNDLATKIIVEPNENEFAKDGFCTIARSDLNYTKENFILNFDYYISQGLLDKDLLEKDLYSTSSNYIGYYYLLNQYNKQYDSITDILVEKQLELVKQKAQLTVLEEKNKALQEQLTSSKSDVMMLAGVTTWEEAEEYITTHTDNTKISSLLNVIAQLQNSINESNEQLNNLKSSIEVLNDYIDTNSARQEELQGCVKELHEKFFKKYSRYIQEGTWQDDNYIDDNKYYLDAVEVAYTSSRPQLQYTIDVMRLSKLEEFSSKVFDVGDICYIQDRQFFGYCADGITPYKLKITISEISSFFDQPEKDIIKVQNYKTQFDDLFQRITAAAQNLQYSEGGYKRAAEAINVDKTINFELLQDTFDNNKDIILNASNQQVTWDSTGITIIDNNDVAQKLRLMAGGIFISNDGGATWKNAVRGDGISTDVLTAGRINTSEIYIYDGNSPSFRWDSNGLTSYSYTENGINFNKFIRHDQYGIYGYDGSSDFVPTSERDIWQQSNFGLTWSGFFLRNKNADTSFEISTDNDLVIKSRNINRVQIGRLNSNTNYGIQLRDNNNNIIFSVDDNGAQIAGWKITSKGLSYGNIDVSDASNIKIGGIPCETRTLVAPTSITVELEEDGTQEVTGEITWTENGTTHTGTATFEIPKYVINNEWIGESCNVICTPINEEE